jgi:hypothetical protein
MGEVKDDEWVGTKLLFENDRVRVWDFQLEPGEATKVHTHRRDWLFVYVTEDNQLRIKYSEDNVRDDHLPEGHVGYFELDNIPEARRTHQAINIGTRPHRQILIEMCEPRAKPADAT